MKISSLLSIIVTIILGLIGIGFIIYIYVTYGGKQISDIPVWVLPFFIGRN